MRKRIRTGKEQRKMEKIGSSKVAVQPMSMGTWAIGGGIQWGSSDDVMSEQAIRCALEQGIAWIDTAPAYGFGHSEEIVGKAIRENRKDVFLATKCGLQWYEEKGSLQIRRDGKALYRDLSASGVRRDLEYSLRRLQTDYLDLYLVHWQSEAEPFIPIEETMGELLRLKKEGKILGIGVCNVTPEQIREYLKWGKLDVIQQKYSMLNRDAEALLPLCRENDIVLQLYSPLEQGLLTDQAAREITLVPGNTRYNNVWWKPENRKQVISMLEGWKDLCSKYECAISNLVIAWTIARSENFNILCGARKPEQVKENAGGLRVALDREDIERMTLESDAVIAGKI